MASKKKAPAKAGPKASAKVPPKPPATAAPVPATAPSGAASGVASARNGAAPPKTPRPKRPPVPSRELTRANPDQPPEEGPTGRTSVYSEWLNQAPQAPNWLNSPPPRKPSPTAKRRAAAKAAEPPDPMQQVLNDQPAPPAPPDEVPVSSASRPAPRRRTTARRITQGERLAVTSAELQAVVVGGTSRAAGSGSSRSAATLAQPGNGWSAPRPTVVAPHATAPQPAMVGSGATGRPAAVGPRFDALSTHDRRAAASYPMASPVASGVREPGGSSGGAPLPLGHAASGRYPTAPHPPATLGQTAGRIQSTTGQSGERLPAMRPSMRPAASSGTNAHLPAVPHEAPGVPAARPEVDSEALLIRGARRPTVPTTGPVAPRRKGPHPILTQVLVALGTIAILLITVTLTSPLGYGAAISGTFQAYAQPFIMVPTPTPTPSPTPIPYAGGAGVSPGAQVIINDINAVFGQYAPGALNVARCESGFDPNARNPYAVGDSHAEGVFQILFPSTWDGTSYHAQSPYNFDANIHAAYEIFSRDGYSWREWQCQP